MLRRCAGRWVMSTPSSDDRAGIGQQQPGDDSQQRALPGARRAEHGDDLAVVDVQRQAGRARASRERSPRRRRRQASSEPRRSWLPEAITTTVVNTSRIVAIAKAWACGSAPGPAEQAADGDRQRLAAGAASGSSSRRTRRARSPRRTRRRPAAAGEGPGRRRATTPASARLPACAAAARRSAGIDRSTASRARTTNGTATSAWPSGTSHHRARQSTGGSVEGDEHAEADGHRRRAERQHQAGVEQLAERGATR